MMTSTIRIAATVAVLISVSTIVAPIALGQELLARPIVVPLPDSADFRAKPDIQYRERDGRIFLMDVFRPAESEVRELPAVIFVHGGPIPESVAKQGKDLGQYKSLGRFITAAGIAGITFSHGFSGVDAFQAADSDVESAIAFILANASMLGIDRDRMCLMAVSAGGSFLAPILKGRPDWLKCVVLYYPVLRPAIMEQLGVGEIFDEQASGLDPFPLVNTFRGAEPAVLIVEAGDDSPVLNADLRRFRDELLNAEWEVEYWNHPNGPHGFDVSDPSLRSRTILYRTREFLREQLVRKP